MNTSPSKIERARRLLDRAIFALLVALTVLVAVPYGSVDPWWEGAYEAAVFALGALWVIEGALKGSWLVAEHRLIVPLAALVVLMLAQAAPLPSGATAVAGVEVWQTISADPSETVRAALKLAALALLFALLLRYTSSARRLRALAYAVVFTGACVALFGIVRQTTGAAGVAAVSQRLATNLDGYAQFINRNHFAFFAEMSLGLALGLASGARRERVPAHVALALPVWAALVLSNSRGGLLGMFAQLIVLTLLYFAAVRRRDERRAEAGGGRLARTLGGLSDSLVFRAVAVGLLLVLTLAGVVLMGGERLASRLEAARGEMSAGPSKVRWGDRRPEIWAATLKVAREHPLAGVGFGAYRAAVTRHHDASGEMSLEQAHNDYLELLASGGLVGLGLAAWFAVSLIRHARRRLRGRGLLRRAACAGALAGLSAVALHSLFDFGLHVTANAHLFAALSAIAVADVPAKNSSQ